jgi:hypothetical protein
LAAARKRRGKRSCGLGSRQSMAPEELLDIVALMTMTPEEIAA